MSVESGGLRGQDGLFSERGARDEAIAVVGVSCRLPKAPDTGSFWEMLRSGGHGLDTPPADRRTLGSGPPQAGYLDGVADFDAAFFGLSPREAVAMDPQQRIVLELAWEALEDAGIVPETVRGSSAGVFVGSLRDDYAVLVGQHGDEAITQNTMTGISRGLIANRVSHHLGLTGPSLTVDAAQASSLVAVHMACASLRSGESSLVLAAGINLNLLPEGELVEERFGALSPDGRCYTFDARANGFVRGEGGGVVVLQPLDQALAEGRRVYGVICGSAVNNDGDTAELTVPGERTQSEMLRRAYEHAGVGPESVQYIELHGTGTPAGDPVEAAALGNVLGRHRSPTEPLYVGSVKTNVGHLEGAAGIVGLIKVLLSLHHRELAPSLNFETPNPRIPLDELNLAVRREFGPWPYEDRPLVAGVSSFGMGGTNCHVVVEEAPELRLSRKPREQDPSAVAWVVSARSEGALRGQAQRLAERVRGDAGLSVADVGFSLVSSRAVMPVRGVVVGSGREDLLEGVEGVVSGRGGPGVVLGSGGVSGVPGVVFVFPGQGHQWVGMAVELWDSSPVFAARMAECGRALSGWVDWDLEEVVRGVGGAPGLDRVDVVQPVLFSVMVSLAELWRSCGVVPSAVVGHSQGEIAAACVAGALSLEDAARVVAVRSRVLRGLSGRGGMVVVGASRGEVEGFLERWSGRLWVGVVNGPGSVVVSGEVGALEEFVEWCEGGGVRCWRLDVDYASHSPLVDEVGGELLGLLEGVVASESEVPFVSGLVGGVVSGEELGAGYWVRGLREPVLFEDAVRCVLGGGSSVFVEVSGHPMLGVGVEQTGEVCGVDVGFVGSLRRGEGGVGSVFVVVG